MKKTLYICSIILMLITSCGIIKPKMLGTGDSGKQAISKSYQLSKKHFISSSIIDTNSIYVTKDLFVTSNRFGRKIHDEVIYYSYLRFSGHGVAFIRNFLLDYPTNELANKMERGQFCFYFVKDRSIKIEIYNGDTRIFEYWYGKILANGDLHFYEVKGRPWGTYKRRVEYIYKKMPANLLNPIIFPTQSTKIKPLPLDSDQFYFPP